MLIKCLSFVWTHVLDNPLSRENWVVLGSCWFNLRPEKQPSNHQMGRLLSVFTSCVSKAQGERLLVGHI